MMQLLCCAPSIRSLSSLGAVSPRCSLLSELPTQLAAYTEVTPRLESKGRPNDLHLRYPRQETTTVPRTGLMHTQC